MPNIVHVTPSDSRQRPTVGIAWLYVLSGLAMIFLCISAIVALSITRPQLDIIVVAGVVFAFGTTTYVSMCSMIKSQEAKHVAKETAYRVDGRLGELLDTLAKQKKLEGLIEGVGAATVAQQAVTPPANGTIPPP